MTNVKRVIRRGSEGKIPKSWCKGYEGCELEDILLSDIKEGKSIDPSDYGKYASKNDVNMSLLDLKERGKIRKLGEKRWKLTK